ncbi:MAG: tetratricopeptide repeat protein [Candidatus Omnitrophica bacterium]|nr:tetratricopeptide repeat protein [Candidatus Omnitrophota bacterium]MDD5553346.1 tetratricopeptide repeat protein [Candidatus Omnitrophota bacterium]
MKSIFILIFSIFVSIPLISNADQGTAANPESASLLRNAFNELKNNELDSAIKDLNEYISLYGADTRAYAGLGNAYSKKGDFDKAKENFDKAISLDNKEAFPYLGLGNAYLRKKDFDKAVENFNKAISLDQNSSHAYVGLGNTYLEKGDFNKAIKTFSTAIGLNENNTLAYSGLIRSYRADKEKDHTAEISNVLEKLKKLDNNLAQELSGSM